MVETAVDILLTSGVFLLGLIAHLIGSKTGVPRVTLLLIFGVAVGPEGFDLVPDLAPETVNFVSITALSFVAFLLGGDFRLKQIRRIGRDVMILSLCIALITAVLVWCAVYLLAGSAALASLFAAIAIATDPVAIRDVLAHEKRAPCFVQRLEGTVIIDDAWAIIGFSLVLALLAPSEAAAFDAFGTHALREIGGALLLGTALGVPMALLTGRIEAGEPSLLEAAGFVLLCSGLSIVLNVSMLLAAMTMGSVTANMARHHKRPFKAVAGIEWPLLVIFFVLAGATLKLGAIEPILGLTLVYCLARTGGRFVGGWSGGKACRRPALERRWYGLALLPQAGVALGVAVVGARHLPEYADIILPVILATTVAFEIIGPVMTKTATNAVALSHEQPSTPP